MLTSQRPQRSQSNGWRPWNGRQQQNRWQPPDRRQQQNQRQYQNQRISPYNQWSEVGYQSNGFMAQPVSQLIDNINQYLS